MDEAARSLPSARASEVVEGVLTLMSLTVTLTGSVALLSARTVMGATRWCYRVLTWWRRGLESSIAARECLQELARNSVFPDVSGRRAL